MSKLTEDNQTIQKTLKELGIDIDLDDRNSLQKLEDEITNIDRESFNLEKQISMLNYSNKETHLGKRKNEQRKEQEYFYPSVNQETQEKPGYKRVCQDPEDKYHSSLNQKSETQNIFAAKATETKVEQKTEPLPLVLKSTNEQDLKNFIDTIQFQFQQTLHFMRSSICQTQFQENNCILKKNKFPMSISQLQSLSWDQVLKNRTLENCQNFALQSFMRRHQQNEFSLYLKEYQEVYKIMFNKQPVGEFQQIIREWHNGVDNKANPQKIDSSDKTTTLLNNFTQTEPNQQQQLQDSIIKEVISIEGTYLTFSNKPIDLIVNLKMVNVKAIIAKQKNQWRLQILNKKKDDLAIILANHYYGKRIKKVYEVPA